MPPNTPDGGGIESKSKRHGVSSLMGRKETVEKMRELYRRTKWLQFFVVAKKPKTVVIEVFNMSEQFLGEIKWYSPWRQYAWNTMYVEAHFNNGCLQDITDVLSRLNEEQKEALCTGKILGHS